MTIPRAEEIARRILEDLHEAYGFYVKDLFCGTSKDRIIAKALTEYGDLKIIECAERVQSYADLLPDSVLATKKQITIIAGDLRRRALKSGEK